jgi:hypothetical protein
MEYDPSLHGHDTRGAALASKNISNSNNPMLALLLKEKRGSTFRLNSCDVHPSGALMIGSTLAGGQISDTLEKLISPSSIYFSPSTNNSSLLQQQQQKQQQQTSNNKHHSNDDDDSLDGHEDYYGPDNGYGDDNFDESSNNNHMLNDNNNIGGDVSLFGTSTSSSNNMSLNQNRKKTSTLTANASRDNQGGPNPWLLLDPHDCTKQQSRPMRPGKTFLVPSLIDPRHEPLHQEEEEVNGKSGKNKNAIPSGGSKKKTKSEAASSVMHFKGLANSEFNYVLKYEKSRKLAVKRFERKTSQYEGHHHHEDDEDEDYGDDNHANYGMGGGGGVDFGVYGEGGNDYDDDDGNDDNDGGYMPNPNAMMSQFDEVQGISHKDSDRNGFGADAINQMELEDAFDQAPKSYAELCKEHIAKFMQGVDRLGCLNFFLNF